jgi:hypothetical protein
LLSDPDIKTAHEPATLNLCLEMHLSDTEARDKAHLDELLHVKYTDLAALHEMRDMLILCRPYAPSQPLPIYVQSEGGTAWKFLRAGFFREKVEFFAEFERQEVMIPEALQQFYEQSANTTRTIALDRQLQVTFWEYIRSWHTKYLEKLKLKDEVIMTHIGDLDIQTLEGKQNSFRLSTSTQGTPVVDNVTTNEDSTSEK